MIYIATVHWQNDIWIDIQTSYIKRFIKTDYKVYAYLDKSLTHQKDKFDYTKIDNVVSHETKLNYLANEIFSTSTGQDDLIMFLDGDAFPLSNILNIVNEHLKDRKLIAVRRTEEDGEKQPHPCFCVTTVKFWKEINGDWRQGYEWKNNLGKKTTDVGGNLLGILTKNNINWLPIERTNKMNLHPVLFAIYGNIIYHHGAGFRYPQLKIYQNSVNPYHLFFQKTILSVFPKGIRHLFPNSLRLKLRADRKLALANQDLSQKVYNHIKNDENFIVDYLNNGQKLRKKYVHIKPMCVIILGMHCSGTSCLAGSLQINGLYSGDVVFEIGNQKYGTRENAEITALNDQLLKHNNGTWDHPPTTMKWNSKLATKRDKIIEKLAVASPSNIWGFKDPRTIFTLPFWLEGLNDFKIVASFRNPTSVAISLASRQNGNITIQDGYRLWEEYNQRLLHHLKNWDIAFISFDTSSDEYDIEISRMLDSFGISDGIGRYPLSFHDNQLLQYDSLADIDSVPGNLSIIYDKLTNIWINQKY